MGAIKLAYLKNQKSEKSSHLRVVYNFFSTDFRDFEVLSDNPFSFIDPDGGWDENGCPECPNGGGDNSEDRPDGWQMLMQLRAACPDCNMDEINRLRTMVGADGRLRDDAARLITRTGTKMWQDEDGRWHKREVNYYKEVDVDGFNDMFENASRSQNAMERTAAAIAPFVPIALAEPTPFGEAALGVAGTTLLLYYTLNQSGNISYPGPWVETQPDPTQFPYRPSPNGPNNKNYFPQGNGNEWVKWAVRLGGAAVLGKKLHEGFNSTPYVAPADNTNVKNPPIKMPFHTPIPASKY